MQKSLIFAVTKSFDFVNMQKSLIFAVTKFKEFL
jgi:hypothetical protein